MNSGQTAAATFGGALLADGIIGGMGLAVMGTAISVPAAAVVATIGGVATAVKLIDEHTNPATPAKNVPTQTYKTFILQKNGFTYNFHVSKEYGYYTYKEHGGSISDKVYVWNIADLRDHYADLLRRGFKRIS